MKTLNLKQTRENISEIKDFVKYLDNNFKQHSKQAKTRENLDDIENSVAFLKDYSEVAEQLMAVIKNYKEKTGF